MWICRDCFGDDSKFNLMAHSQWYCHSCGELSDCIGTEELNELEKETNEPEKVS